MEDRLQNQNMVFAKFMNTACGSLDLFRAPGNSARKPERGPPPMPKLKLVEDAGMLRLYNRRTAAIKLDAWASSRAVLAAFVALSP